MSVDVRCEIQFVILSIKGDSGVSPLFLHDPPNLDMLCFNCHPSILYHLLWIGIIVKSMFIFPDKVRFDQNWSNWFHFCGSHSTGPHRRGQHHIQANWIILAFNITRHVLRYNTARYLSNFVGFGDYKLFSTFIAEIHLCHLGLTLLENLSKVSHRTTKYTKGN